MVNSRHSDPDFRQIDSAYKDYSSQSIVHGGSFQHRLDDEKLNMFQQFARSFSKRYRTLISKWSDPILQKRRALYRNHHWTTIDVPEDKSLVRFPDSHLSQIVAHEKEFPMSKMHKLVPLESQDFQITTF